MRKVKPHVRKLYDMKDVVFDRRWLSDAKDRELYYMYRELSLITIIPPQMMGCEYVKTAGHYHPCVPHTDVSYPELYEVLEGEAHYLLQKCEEDAITDAILIKAGEGEKVIIPPGYGHITINASLRRLRMANWVARDFESLYAPIREKGGGAYFFLDRGIVQNPSYVQVPEIRLCKPANIKGLPRSKEVYGLVKDIRKLEFLTKPHEYEWVFEKLYDADEE